MSFEIEFSVTNGTLPASSEVFGPREQDWWVIPNGDAGGAYLELPATWYLVNGHGVSGAEYRYQTLSAVADSRTLNDPVGTWSGWQPLGSSTGRQTISGLPTVPCAVQIRVERNGAWSRPSTFKRLGTYFYDYDDTIATWPGCVEQVIPALVIWGTDNIAGEGGQRVPDDTTAIVSGDPGSHFEIAVGPDGRTYLRPTATGVSTWTAGDNYSVTLNDASSTNVQIRIDLDTAVIRSSEWSIGGSSVQEMDAYYQRMSDLSGKTLLLRPGFYRPQNMPGNSEKNHHGLDGLSSTFVLAAADATQKPLVGRLAINTPGSGTANRNIRFENLHFFEPQFAYAKDPGSGNQTSLEAIDIAADGGNSSIEIANCRLSSDYIESRYGFQVRGSGVERVQIHLLDVLHTTGLHVHDNVFMYCYYPQTYIGCAGTIERNLVTHVAADYVNPQPTNVAGYEGPLIYRNNRHREHMGDQANVHSDAFHIWRDGTHDGLRIEGNIWITGFEGRACPGQVPAVLANNPFTQSADFSLTSGDMESYRVCLTDANPINVTIPQSATLANGTEVAFCNFGTTGNTVYISDGAGYSYVLSGDMAKVRLQVTASGWRSILSNKSFQGLYNNNGTQSFFDTAWRHNIVAGLTSVSAALVNATGTAQDFYVYGNSFLHNLLTPADDIDGDGLITGRDGDAGTTTAKVRINKSGNGIAEFKNVVPEDDNASSNNVAPYAWDNHYLGRPDFDSVGARNLSFEGAAAANDYRPCETFAEAIEQARVKAGSALDNQMIGAVGPLDTSTGFWNFATGSFNGYPAPKIERTTPAEQGAQPLGANIELVFNYPMQLLNSAGITLANVTDSVAVAATVSLDGRTLTVSPDNPLIDGKEYEVAITPDALAIWDAPGLLFSGLAAGDFRFVAQAEASANVLARFNALGADFTQFFSGTDVAVVGNVRFDTNHLGNPGPNLPTGNATWSIEVEKGTAFEATLLLTGGADSGLHELDIDAAGAVSNQPSGTVGVDFGVIDMGTHWKLWIIRSGASVTRYYWDVNSGSAVVNIRRPMLVDKADANAPWVSPIAPYAA